MANEGKAYQIKITLRDIKPEIWRRFLVRDDITLFQLHQVILAVMGWAGYHIHNFRVSGKEYATPDPEFDLEGKIINDKKVLLHDVIKKEGAKFEYVYDFGDNWEHDLVVEKISPIDPKTKYPLCIDGARACPPEDCGSTPGYEELLEAIADTEHERHEELLTWVGEDYDPERLDLDEANETLASIDDDYGDEIFD